MGSEQLDDLEYGLRVVRRLPEVTPQLADARVRRMYNNIRATLRVPTISPLFRLLANYPGYLQVA